MGKGGPIWWERGAYLVGKGDLFWGGMGLIWWGRETYLIGEGGLFGGGGEPIWWGRVFFFRWGMGALLGWGGELLDKRGPGSLYLYQCLQ